jgi:hypothetical protein
MLSALTYLQIIEKNEYNYLRKNVPAYFDEEEKRFKAIFYRGKYFCEVYGHSTTNSGAKSFCLLALSSTCHFAYAQMF